MGLKLPEELAVTLGDKDITLEKTNEGVLIKPAYKVIPLKKWAGILSTMKIENEPELDDWDNTINDGLE